MTFPQRGSSALASPRLAPPRRIGRSTWHRAPRPPPDSCSPAAPLPAPAPAIEVVGSGRNRAAVPEFPGGAMRPTEVHMTLFVRRLLIGIAVVGTLSSGPGAKATPTPSLVGTLTCTAEAAPSEAKQLGGWKLSCAFEQAGTASVQQYGGEITGLDQGTRSAGAKALLLWTVLTGEAPRTTANLVGVYKTT